MSIKFALITERKNPPDKRVVFSPDELESLSKLYPDAVFKVESSDIRVFTDDDYRAKGFDVVDDVSDCDVFLGVKEVPVDALIADKKYFFFSHTIKKQNYNRKLLQAILAKNIELYDHETIVNESGRRLIGFGRYAGIVGAYNGFRAWGLKNRSYNLPKASMLPDLNGLIEELNTIQLPAIKILLTGSGKVAFGAKEMLDAMSIQEVSIEEYLTQSFEEAVYCRIHVLDYNKPKEDVEVELGEERYHFYNNPGLYESNFSRFAKVTDFFIAGHFYGEGAPHLFTREDANAKDFQIKLVADVSCDVDGPIASTIRPSTIADPIYGYDPKTGSEIDFMDPNAIVVMAVDNLPCELPYDASQGFGHKFTEHVMPAFYNEDADGVLARAQMTSSGKLTERFKYLQSYVDGK